MLWLENGVKQNTAADMRQLGGRMVECSSRSRCAGKIWYHLECLQMRSAPRGKWVCPDCVSSEKMHDGKLAYTKLLLWMGLNDKIRHAAFQRNDGNATMRHWRVDLTEFHARGHHKYFILAHRLLSFMNGAASPQLSHSLKWNRTVNVSGGPNRNLEMDPYMEMLNRAYKESSRASKGQLTEATVNRHSRMLAVNTHVDALFDQHRCVRRKHGKPNRCAEVKQVAAIVVRNGLTKSVPGRYHHGLETMRLKQWTTPADMGKLRSQILQHRLNMFLSRRMTDL